MGYGGSPTDSTWGLTYCNVRVYNTCGYLSHERLPYHQGGRLERNNVSKKLYVGNLSYETTSDDLMKAFSEHGKVSSAEVVVDRETGRSRGFGFVEMSDGAAEAIKALDLTELQGRNITVNEARPREDRRGGGKRGGRRAW
jgi:RNA recognition motif-containing protein